MLHWVDGWGKRVICCEDHFLCSSLIPQPAFCLQPFCKPGVLMTHHPRPLACLEILCPDRWAPWACCWPPSTQVRHSGSCTYWRARSGAQRANTFLLYSLGRYTIAQSTRQLSSHGRAQLHPGTFQLAPPSPSGFILPIYSHSFQ